MQAYFTGIRKGNGIFSSILQKYLTIDIGSDYVAQSIPGLKNQNIFKQCLPVDATNMPFADNSLSTVIFVHGIDHIEDKNIVVQEVARVLNAKGCFAFSDISDKWDMNLISKLLFTMGLSRFAERYRIYRRSASLMAENVLSPMQYKELLNRNGFIIKEMRYFDNMRFHEMRALMRFIDLELKPLTGIWLRKIEALIHKNRLLNVAYKHVVSKAFLPIVENDQRLCEKEEGGNIFFIAEKCCQKEALE